MFIDTNQPTAERKPIRLRDKPFALFLTILPFVVAACATPSERIQTLVDKNHPLVNERDWPVEDRQELRKQAELLK